MLVNDELDTPKTHESARAARRMFAQLPPGPRSILLLFLFFGAAVLLQVLSHAPRAEFGGYPDEPAHYVTSLMVREYITGPSPLSPMQFAENYYAHYPKVAFGHWPPLFYLVQALWMLLFSDSRLSVLLELAATTALLAHSLYSEARRWFGSQSGALLAGLLIVSLPLVQLYTDEEMSETLLVLVCFWSAVYLARYIDSERWQDSLWFGVFFALAVLTKGSGWLLAMLPPIALLLTRKLHLVLRRSFWVSAAVVAATCLPWQLTTMRLAEEGWVGGSSPSVGYTVSALARFLPIFGEIVGPFLAVLAVVGIVVTVLAPMFRRPVDSHPAVMLALVFAVWVFHSVVPAGVEDRKLIIALPAFILFVFAGGYWIAGWLPFPLKLRPWRGVSVAALGALFFFLQTFSIPRERHYGYTEAARFLTSDSQLRGAKILVSSGWVGEGLLVSEVAMRQPRPRDTIIRATKAMAKVDWSGARYHSLFSSPAQVMDYLDRENIGVVVTDTFGGAGRIPHHELLAHTIAGSGRFQPIGTFPGDSLAHGEVHVYRLLH